MEDVAERVIRQVTERFEAYLYDLIKDLLRSNIQRDFLDCAQVRIDVQFNVENDFLDKLEQLLRNRTYNGVVEIIEHYKYLIKEAIKNHTHVFQSQAQEILKIAKMLLEKGFEIDDEGRLVYRGRIHLKKVADNYNVIDLPPELQEKYYVEDITVKLYPFEVRAYGRHPHMYADGKYCTGDVKDIYAFIKAFPMIFEVAYVYSFAYKAEDIKDYFDRHVPKEGW